MAPVVNGAQGILAIDQAGAFASLTLSTTPCPNVKQVCGFNPGMTAVITDGAGHHDVFVVESTVVGSRTLTADRGFSYAYPAGAAVIEIDQHTYALAVQPDGSSSLLRETAAGAGQPVVDYVAALSFRAAGQSVDVTVIVQAATEPLRRVIADRVFRSSIKWRNRHEKRERHRVDHGDAGDDLPVGARHRGDAGVFMDRLATGNMTGSVAMLYAADSGIEIAARDLAQIDDWNVVLNGEPDQQLHRRYRRRRTRRFPEGAPST